MFVDGAAYEAFMGRWSRRLAPLLVAFAGVRDGTDVLDVGCGTGPLSRAVRDVAPQARVTGIDPSAGFVELARAAVPDARFEVGDAQVLPFGDASVDAALSLLALNFVPDHVRAAREMRRVTRPGGVVAAAVWDYGDGMEMLYRFWEVACAVSPDANDVAEHRMPLCHQGELAALLRGLGLRDVVEQPLEIRCEYASFDDYWLPFLGGVGPSGQYVVGLSESRRTELRDVLRREVAGGDDGPFALGARAWAVRGTVQHD